MVVLKHAVVFLASLATLAAASPTSATGVAHHGKPSGTAAGGDMGSHENDEWHHSPTGHDGSFQKDDDAGSANHHQARDEGIPIEYRAFSSHKWADAPQHTPVGKEENDKTYKQHHRRTEEVLETLRRLAREEDDHEKHPRDVDHDRHDDNHGHAHAMEDGSHNHTESGEHVKDKHYDTRATTEKGVYECANQNWVQPCHWTPLQEGQCYNRLYGRLGSMGPDNGLSCTIYEQPNCNDKGWNTCGPFVYPGMKNYQTSHLLLYNGMSDDGIFSIKCKWVSCQPFIQRR
ncbi:uncharacterized protein Z520_00921 [Fonsecaea multimorphosa CBS 102226]|uniref:Secreted protein n=1 Tax=Fonsecaea multimorphosa CBS 102226 TaxID=1442371 RepID=A0A0D2J442_9EURO|nr:uncharacterized protein Z520_00921 [Fonsecaea multimorphosa CBS 102226]KIY04227.1 hypothetical protein Z520_00921 [Fonsecaea multimorphosa CBS 102226]OAL32051.1 hypothetical protein AYO22_00921 [Fonsecaea multimorphosa]